MSAGPYTTIAEMTSKADAAFILECADDDNSGTLSATETGYVTDRADEASDMFFARLGLRYTDAALAASPYIRRGATAVACWLLSKRRANPPKFQSDYDFWFGKDGIPGELDKIEDGTKRIPDALPMADPTAMQSTPAWVAGQPSGKPDVIATNRDPLGQRRQHPINTDWQGGGGFGGLF